MDLEGASYVSSRMSGVRLLIVLFVSALVSSEAEALAQSGSLRDPDVLHPRLRGDVIQEDEKLTGSPAARILYEYDYP